MADYAEQTAKLTARDILLAFGRMKRAGYVHRTLLEQSEPLSARLKTDVYQKLELFQRTGSFKLRGATNKLLKLLEDDPGARRLRFVTASAGNHAIGLGFAARALGAKATIVVPATASPAKLETLRRFPVELILEGNSYDSAEAYARKLEVERGLVFVSAYNDREVAAGGGTVAVEALADLPDADVLLVPVGGGGLISGIVTWAKSVSPKIKVFGVQSEASPAMQNSLAAGRLVQAHEFPTLADGLAGNIEPGAITFNIVEELVDDILLVTEEEIAQAIRYYVREQHIIVEGSGAVGMAALLSDRVPLSRLGLVRPKIMDFVTGRNIANTKLREIID